LTNNNHQTLNPRHSTLKHNNPKHTINMPNIVDKIKDAVLPDKSHNKGAPEGTHGPHNTRTANAMDPRVDSDRDNSKTMGGGGGGMGTGRTAGHGEYGSSGYGTGTAEGTHGPHGSRAANAMDPRVDSDRDNSKTMGGGTGGMGMGTGRTAGYGTGTAEGTHGPHSSRAANAMDPRVDSDRDNSKTMGGGTGGMGMGTGRTAGHGEYGSTGYGTGTAEGTHGPHSSRAANAMDPRVDSDRDNSKTMGGTGAGPMGGGIRSTGGMTGSQHTPGTGAGGSGMTGMTGTHGEPTGTHGPHSSRMANAADPRVDSDRDGRGAIGTGPGPARNTAGPHSSDMANKMDPRVDSDLDNSRTMGGNKTYQ
jgi:hypothetical protein